MSKAVTFVAILASIVSHDGITHVRAQEREKGKARGKAAKAKLSEVKSLAEIVFDTESDLTSDFDRYFVSTFSSSIMNFLSFSLSKIIVFYI